MLKSVGIDNRHGHGGGTFEYDGSNIIPMGALKSYKGPCPMNPWTPRFEIRVKAIDEHGKVIAFGKKIKDILLYLNETHLRPMGDR
jgi:hypothetical protein